MWCWACRLIALLSAAAVGHSASWDTSWRTLVSKSPQRFMKTNKCMNVPEKMEICKEIGYTKMSLPNNLGQMSSVEAAFDLSFWKPLVKKQCSDQLRLFLCTMYAPVCVPEESHRPIKPCRELCEIARDDCKEALATLGFDWPQFVECDQFSVKQTVCIPPFINMPEATTRWTPPPTIRTTQEDRSAQHFKIVTAAAALYMAAPVATQAPDVAAGEAPLCDVCRLPPTKKNIISMFCNSTLAFRSRVQIGLTADGQSVAVRTKGRVVSLVPDVTPQQIKKFKLQVNANGCQCSHLMKLNPTPEEKRIKLLLFVNMDKDNKSGTVVSAFKWDKTEKSMKKASKRISKIGRKICEKTKGQRVTRRPPRNGFSL